MHPHAGARPLLDEPFLAQSPQVVASAQHVQASPLHGAQPHVEAFHRPPDLEPIGSLTIPGLAAPANLPSSGPGTPVGTPFSSPKRGASHLEQRGAAGGFAPGQQHQRLPSKLGPGVGGGASGAATSMATYANVTRMDR